MNRRTLVALALPLLLIGGYYGTMAWIRAHVDDLVQHAVDAPLPAFRLVDRTGRIWTEADVRQKRAVLHFFRSRCGSCEVEAPEMRAFEQALPADVVLLHVMTDAVLGFPPELAAPTIAAKGYTAPVLMADVAFVDAFHSVRWSDVTPITYVVDAKGVVRHGLRGAQTRATIAAALAAAKG